MPRKWWRWAPGVVSPTGLPVQPWVMDTYAPGAAAVSTAGDLAKLTTALLDGTAPGMAALEPTTNDASDLGSQLLAHRT